MTRRRLALVLAAVAVATACGGGERRESGTASLWITRDRGAAVVFEGSVPAGISVMDALQRHADVETRYGGRFVHAINGVEGSLAGRRDWFYFVNGFEGDRSAVEYRLRSGDVAWWDYRSWRGTMGEPVVVGAFPEPFVHGYDGRRRPAAVRYRVPAQAGAARALARVIRARSVAPASVAVPDGTNVLRLERGPVRFQARLRSDGGPGSPVEFVLAGDAMRLARNPELARFRYEGLP